ncbi:carotenoid cleavage dioxygenase 1 [Coniella lustricola]|uniref:Carotenoid cleavage dioxygenase 1 n=1 Tax=Coniella lustricola TaxID=2025994 RepID=A0A2T2ZXI8_9PEZI|nr:carotenoid cleavage dioxygenase 1 [Coniella lustricola]
MSDQPLVKNTRIGASEEMRQVSRTADQERGDREQVVQNLTTGALLDWPNKAGFENLTEHRGPIELTVKGTIPAWTAGALFRNGPGSSRLDGVKTKDGSFALDHWFDGIAHLHRFDITVASNNAVKVFYSSRRQAEGFVKHVHEKGSLRDMITFAQKADPCIGIFSKAMSCYKALDQRSEARKYDNLNVTVLPAIDVPGLFAHSNNKTCGDKTSSDTTQSGHRVSSSKIWVASDTASLQAIDTTTLKPVGNAAVQGNLHPDLKGAMSCAHAQIDPVTGDMFNYNIQGGPKAIYRIFRISAATGKTDILATFSRPGLPPAYIHSFFLSERFVILRVPSTHFGKMGLSVPWEGNLMAAMVPFNKNLVNQWFVIDRIHGQGVVAELKTPAGFFFHSVNCWDEIVPMTNEETDGSGAKVDVTCDVVEFPTTDILHKFYHNVILNANGDARKAYSNLDQIQNIFSSLVRYKFRVSLPQATSPKMTVRSPGILSPNIVFTIPSPHTGELPTINPRFHTKPYRYLYSLPQTGRSTLVDTIAKTDTVTREAILWNNPTGHTPGEAIFVPRPGSEEEDDGVLLSVVLDGCLEKSYLLCLDAKTMQELGRAEMDFAVGIGLHGVHHPK